MEVLAGARDQEHLQQLRQLLARATMLPTESIDYDTAAALYRSCRGQGKTVRKLIGCLIGRGCNSYPQGTRFPRKSCRGAWALFSK
jgi:predicted nucleic acid-binding protein